MHVLEREVRLNVSSQGLWDFIATPMNLNELTPPDLDFRVISKVPQRMYNGLTILYDLRIPLIGRQRWLTEIKHVREGVSFVDEQRIGPYALWYHYHEVEAINDGETRMLDRVHYRLPFEPLSRPVQQFWVGKKLSDIFDYRSERLAQIFP